MAGRTAWYPGHMAKGKRELEKLLSSLDVVLEVRDARAPYLTASPFASLYSRKGTHWVALTKADLANDSVTTQWVNFLKSQGTNAFALDLRGGRPDKLKKALVTQGPKYRGVRLAVFGIPNVGKSQLLNGLVGKKAAPVGGIPGLTKGVSWYQADQLLVVDSPGILDPKGGAREEQALAWLGCSKIDVIGGYEASALALLAFLQEHNLCSLFEEKWGVSGEGTAEEILQRLGVRLGCLVTGGAVDPVLTGRRLIESFQTGKLGKFSLERPNKPLFSA